MDAIDNITTRNSARELIEPHPSAQEMETVFEAALRAPDHAWLRPSKFWMEDGSPRIAGTPKTLMSLRGTCRRGAVAVPLLLSRDRS